MKLFEVLNFYREPIKRLVSAGFRPDDCKYLDLYSDYLRLCGDGGKKTWVVAALAEKYAVSERKVWSIISHMETDCTKLSAQ